METTLNGDVLHAALEIIRARWPAARPAAGFVLGSGWSDAAAAFERLDGMAYDEFTAPVRGEVAGHPGKLILATAEGAEILIFQGRRHWYEGLGWTPVALPLYLLKKLGVKLVVLTNAAGGVRDSFVPGTLMAIEDHINAMGVNPLTGPHDPFWGARFPDQTRVYDRRLLEAMDRAAHHAGVVLQRGVYLACAGPAYETPAEVRAFRAWGADAVGMSTVPEAVLAHAAGLRVAGLSCISNPAAGLSSAPLTHDEVTQTINRAGPQLRALLAAFWKEVSRETVSRP